MSESAGEFIGPQTFAAITGVQPVTSLFEGDSVSPHTELGRWADLVIVAPATAATLGRLAAGISSDAVGATVLATTAPVLLAPAMHTEMWEHPATRRNLEILRGDGYHTVGPEIGSLAGGDVGVGRVAEPDEIVDVANHILAGEGRGRVVLVTAGGTREPFDPVRFIGNRSSGKMGHAIADEASRRGFDVTLVTTSELPSDPSVKVVRVETADEMLEAVSGVEAEYRGDGGGGGGLQASLCTVGKDRALPRACPPSSSARLLTSSPRWWQGTVVRSLLGLPPRPEVSSERWRRPNASRWTSSSITTFRSLARGSGPTPIGW